MECYDITTWRSRYLERIRRSRNVEEKPVVYLDETYIHNTYHAKSCWQSEEEPGMFVSESSGSRWIIAHAGTENGFVNGTLLMFKSQSKSSDYQDDMNSTNFLKWMSEKVILNLPERSLVVMDNAPYHCTQINKAPTMSNPPTYVVDALLKSHNHELLKLPPYHCDLNLIEKMWRLVKRRVADKNVGQDPKEIVRLTEEAFETVTAEDWAAQCKHVQHLEKEYLKNDGLMDEEIDRFIISTGSNSETESDSVSIHSSDSDHSMTDHNYSIKL
ncbi:hypothetical protein K1T71_009633 [Dendrolimus kikuchii]|uniref:Uncharacterized protein n=1 Tax=Dendrolimus kikuchii TaxID=765133 RepID=A0ACC1CSD7_9NEOP|nr:hypothetical protein K1T71_009633 [Dendrolimus kikuchii]